MIRKTIGAALLALSAHANAVDSFSFEYGRGEDDTDLWRIGMQWEWRKLWHGDHPWSLGAYWDLQFGHWNAQEGITDISVTPVFRLQRVYASAIPYIEAAIGFHLLSDERINSGRVLGTRFQYGDHIGVGARFGERRRWDISMRVQHISNGGLEHPNPGINFVQTRVQYHF